MIGLTHPYVRTTKPKPCAAETALLRVQGSLSASKDEGDHSDITQDDANYPHACFCPREGCEHRATCAFFHFGQQEWTR